MVKETIHIEFKKAMLIFLVVAVLIVTTGFFVGEAFFWNQDNSTPLEKDILHVESLVANDKGNHQLLVELGWLYYRKGDYQEAVKVLTKAVEANKNNPAAYYNLGLAYQEIKLLDKAEEEFLKTLELDQESRFAYFSLGKLYFIQEKWDQAITNFRLATEKTPGSADNYYWLGQAYEKNGYMEEAAAAYQKVLDLIPNHSEAKEAYYRVK